MLLTVAITAATVWNASHYGFIYMLFHTDSLLIHRTSVVGEVIRMEILAVVLLRREIGKVGILIALAHSIVRIVH